MEQELRNLVFISSNKNKIAEVKNQFLKYNIKIIEQNIEIKELQESDSNNLIRDKVIKCFQKVKHEFIVEHTELMIDNLNGFPSLHTSVFWKTLGAQKICEISNCSTATAVTYIGYCNGKTIEIFSGQTEGSIALSPKGETAFQWDCIFIPKGTNKTFAQLGKNKEDYSMRQKAIDKFMEHYNGRA